MPQIGVLRISSNGEECQSYRIGKEEPFDMVVSDAGGNARLRESVTVPVKYEFLGSDLHVVYSISLACRQIFGNRMESVLQYDAPYKEDSGDDGVGHVGSLTISADGVNEMIEEQQAKMLEGYYLQIRLVFTSIDDELDWELAAERESVRMYKKRSRFPDLDTRAKAHLLNNMLYVLPGNGLRKKLLCEQPDKKTQAHQYIGKGHSEKFLGGTWKQFYADVDAALRQVGVSEDLIDVGPDVNVRATLGDNSSSVYSENICNLYEAYTILRKQGYNCADITW